jgi:hypothetical protein
MVLASSPASSGQSAVAVAIEPEVSLQGWLSAYWGPAFFSETSWAWASVTQAWLDYVGRLATSASPFAAFDAGQQLMSDSFDIAGRAAAARLHAGHVFAPLLVEA